MIMLKRKIIKNKMLRFLKGIRNGEGYALELGTQNEIGKIEWLKKKLLELPKGISILDAGAGELQFKGFCKHLNYTSQDFGQYDGKGDSSGLQTQKWNNSKLDIISDITEIPCPDEFFDAIMCVEVLEHVPDPVLALKELNRLLKKGGTLIITVPFASLTHFAPYHFFTGFNRYFFEDFARKNNYYIEDLTPNGGYFEYFAQELRRVEYVAQKYSNIYINKEVQELINAILIKLDNLNKMDSGSSELLTCGYFFKGVKL